LGTESKAELTLRAERAELAEKAKPWNWIECPNIHLH
jgi:hypothetical protein